MILRIRLRLCVLEQDLEGQQFSAYICGGGTHTCCVGFVLFEQNAQCCITCHCHDCVCCAECSDSVACSSKCDVCKQGFCDSKCATGEQCDEATGACLSPPSDRYVYASPLTVYSAPCAKSSVITRLAPCAKFSYLGGGAQRGYCDGSLDGFMYVVVDVGSTAYLQFKAGTDAIHASNPCSPEASTSEQTRPAPLMQLAAFCSSWLLCRPL